MQLLRYAGSQVTWAHSLFNGILKECYCLILGILCKRVLLPCVFFWGGIWSPTLGKTKTLILTILKMDKIIYVKTQYVLDFIFSLKA